MSSTKNALITGASRGIGRAIALRLADLGYNLFLLARDEQMLADVVATAVAKGVKAASLAGEITDEAYLDEALALARSSFGSVDVLVNNAGIGVPGNIEDCDFGDWQRCFAINVDSIFHGCQKALPLMREHAPGSIVNISSASAQSGEGSPHYVTSKSALIGLTRQLSRELAPRGIRVNAVAPGPTNTPIMHGLPQEWITSMEQSVPLGRMADPSEVAGAVSYLLSDDASFVTGSVLVANGGSYCF